jgi:hypothetical protein
LFLYSGLKYLGQELINLSTINMAKNNKPKPNPTEEPTTPTQPQA